MEKISRRKFLFKQATSGAALFASANAAVYVIGSAFKSLDGSLTAGAKAWVMISNAPTFSDPGYSCYPEDICDVLNETTSGAECPGVGYTSSIWRCQ